VINPKALSRALLVAALALTAPRPAQAAATACGTIITNTAMITMWSGPIDQIGYEVSYGVTSTVMIICPITAIRKYAVPQEVSSGGAVTFYICVDNQRMSADGSVWNVTITDRLPYGLAMDQVSLAQMNAYNYGVPALAGTDISWASSLAGPWTTWATPPGAGQVAPFYIRWRVSSIGTLKSGCVAFHATVQ